MKTNARQAGLAKPAIAWFLTGVLAVGLGVMGYDYVQRQIMPFGLIMPPLDGKDRVDPRIQLTVQATGFNAQLSKVELSDETGKVLAEDHGKGSVTLSAPLAFGAKHKLKATVERPWFGQSETKEVAFTTVAIPKLEGPTVRMLSPDAGLSLKFDQPIGKIEPKSDLHLAIQPAADTKQFQLVASDYSQDHTYTIDFDWQTDTGVPLPPFRLEVITAPPLTAEIPLQGQSNLGVAFPMTINFSEPLADRANIGRAIKVRAGDGTEVAGKWEHIGKKSMRFNPQPGWPASSTIEVSVDPSSLRSIRGGTLEKPMKASFSTGADRHIYVYLDAQRMAAVENGEVVRTFKVSTGKAKTPTVTGNFYIYDRYRHKTMRSDPNVRPGQHGYYQVDDVPYTQFFHKDYAFHGAFWHNSFGHPASHGCVNMSTKDKNRRWPGASEDAGWLFKWAGLGVPVTVYAKSPAIPKLEAETDTQNKLPDAAKKEREPLSAKKSEPVARLETGLHGVSPQTR